jgi:small subunit ribosomal protein S8
MEIYYMLNCIKQGYINKKKSVNLVSTKKRIYILKILCQHGFIRGYVLRNKDLEILLKYNNGRSVINSLNSSLNPKIYLSAENLSRSYHKELLILTTSKGILTAIEARHQGLGGHLLFSIL